MDCVRTIGVQEDASASQETVFVFGMEQELGVTTPICVDNYGWRLWKPVDKYPCLRRAPQRGPDVPDVSRETRRRVFGPAVRACEFP